MSEIKISLRTGTSGQYSTYTGENDQYSYEPDIKIEFIYFDTPRTQTFEKKNFLNLNPCSAEHSEECSICQVDFSVGERISKLSCSHCFHYRCIKQWTNHKPTCPLCRKSIPILER